MIRRILVAGGVACLVAVLSMVSAAPSSAMPSAPAQQNWNTAFAYWAAHPDAIPPGMNVPGCVPAPSHPRPVVLINGAFESKYINWAYIAPMLARLGYCVYGTDYGQGRQVPLLQVDDLRESAAEIGRFVDHVRQETGSPTVDIVGHSEGGLVTLYYLNQLGGAAKVHNMVGLAPITNGVTIHGLLAELKANPALARRVGDTLPVVRDGTAGSDFVGETGRGGMTRRPVQYLTISSQRDLVVTTAESALPRNDSVTNVIVQDYCPQDFADHNSMVYDENVLAFVGDRLAGTPLSQPNCRSVAPFVHLAQPW